jgi:hypothetical protein
MPATEPEADLVDGEAQETKPKDKGTPGASTSSLSDDVDPKSKPTTTTSRRLTTLSEAETAFEEDELRLADLLGGKAVALDTGSCSRVCDALASLRRSADAICELAGDDDERCGQARQKLEGNEQRVAGRGCRCN